MSEEDTADYSFIKLMLQRYWKVGILWIIGIVGAVVGAILTLSFVIVNSDIGGYGTWTIGDFSFGTLIIFLLWLALWELLFVGLPAAVYFGLTFGLWWYRLPDDEKELIKQKRG